MPARVRGRILCEDRRHEAFLVRLLKPIFGRDVDVRIAPSGAGAASAWVLKQYPAQVREYLRRHPGQNKALVIMVDGDNCGVRARHAETDQALRDAGEVPRGKDERISVLVPTWSIETWLLFLQGDVPVDETASLKERAATLLVMDLPTLVERFRALGEEAGLPSLTDALVELGRVQR